MAYDELLLQRVRNILQKTPGIAEKKMFGGVGFLLHGNMACGILNDDLIVRVGLEDYDDALNAPHARRFDLTGRVMKGWVILSGTAVDSEKDLSTWVQRGVSYAGSLPEK